MHFIAIQNDQLTWPTACLICVTNEETKSDWNWERYVEEIRKLNFFPVPLQQKHLEIRFTAFCVRIHKYLNISDKVGENNVLAK